MKLRELSYFFEIYNIPSLRYVYPKNIDLWNAFNKQENEKLRVDILKEIEWVLKSDEKEQRQVMKYLNQVGLMGYIHFKNEKNMIEFLNEMKDNIIV